MTRGLTTLSLCLALTLPAFGQWCISAHDAGACGTDEYISNVAIGTLNNPSVCDAIPHYENFKSLGDTHLVQGVAAPITVNIGTYWTGDQVEVFCDWNGNGVLTDAGEVTTLAIAPGVATGSITPPIGAASLTLMRVKLRYNGVADPCATTGFGNTEDYLVSTSCVSAHTAGACGIDEYIANVTIGSLNNSSTCDAIPHYEDFTGLTPPTLPAGASYPIAVTVGTYWATDQVDVFCDWNHNGVLNDPGEAQTLAIAPGLATGNVVVPNTASGWTLMRVKLRYGGVQDPCSTTGYGNTEDYSVLVAGIPPCALAFSSPNGPGSIKMENTPCPAAAGGTYLNAIVLSAGTTPSGWFFGLDIPLNQLVSELQSGYPFSGPLDGSGSSTFLLPAGAPSGLQLWAVSANFTPGFGSFLLQRGVVSYTIP